MNLKDEYEFFVTNPKQEHLESLVSKVIKHCKDEMTRGKELPYVVTLDNVEINSVHDLTAPLKEEGVNCSASFKLLYSIEVTVHNFI